ncbi:peroxiredoxin family protein [Dethiobacter alkaliphilus]|nr:redoxin domain-containing protein [Dethiobacter alkaliphilus]
MNNKAQKGSMAPDFSLSDVYGKKMSFSDFRGRSVILVFMRHLG